MGTHNNLSISHFIKAAASFDRHDLKFQELMMDWWLVTSWKKKTLFPIILQVKVANKRLGPAEAFLSCQKQLLNKKYFLQKKFFLHWTIK